MKSMKTKRSIATLLCLALLLTLLPITASAENYDHIKPNSYSSLEALLAANSGYKGEIVRYVAPHTGDNDTDYVRIDFGVYHLSNTTTVDFRFAFNPADVKLVKADKSDIAFNNLNGTVNSEEKTKILEHWNYPEGFGVGDGADVIPGSPVVGGDYGMFRVIEGADIDVPSAKTTGPTGYFGFSYGVDTASGMAEYITVFNENPKSLNTEALDDVFYLSSAYFRVIGDVTAETFGLYEWASNYTGGFTQIAAINNPNIAFIGFPAKTYPVQVNVKGSDNAKLAAGATVQITGDGYDKTFTTNTTGGLVDAGTEVTDSVLNLPAGSYTYKITPTESTYDETTKTFTVVASDSTDAVPVDLICDRAGGGGGESGTYTVTLTDSEYPGNASALVGKTVTVTADGVTAATGTVGAGGAVTLNTGAQTAAKNVLIQIDGYEDKTTSLTFNSDGSITGNSNIAMAQKKTNVTLKVPTAQLPAFVKLEADPNGTVTDAMKTKLPLTAVADSDGNVLLEDLPDGDYIYTIVSPGNEDKTMELDVKNTGLLNDSGDNDTGKVVVTDPETSTPTDVTVTNGDAEVPSASVGTPEAIEDPLYIVQGEWRKNVSGEVVGMDIKVFLKNTTAAVGSFGLKYDSTLFSDASVQINKDSNKIVIENRLLQGGPTLTNPQTGSGYVLLDWVGKDGLAFDTTTTAEQLFTIQLDFAAGVDDSNYQSKVTNTTLTCLDFTDSAWNTTISTYFGADTASAATFAKQYWRATDAENNNPPAGSLRLDQSKALGAGFYQTMNVATDPAEGQDTRMQILYETYGSTKTLTFEVKDAGGNPVAGATVTVYTPGGTLSGTTDATGKVAIPVAQDVSVTYDVTATGYLPKTGEGPVTADNDKTVPVTMSSNVSHDVVLHDDNTATITLAGGSKAYNGQDYSFTLGLKPGYVWQSGMPAASDLTVKMVPTGSTFDAVSDTLTVSWDSAGNCYKISGSGITDINDTSKIVVKVAANVESANLKVNISSGNGGKFDVTTQATGSSFTPGVTTGMTGSIVETLGSGKSASSVYKFIPDGPIDATEAANKASGNPYKAYVIKNFAVNGVSMTLTNAQIVDGVENFELTGIASNQTVAVTYGIATIENGEPVGPIDPVPGDKANVTLILSDFGSAEVKTSTDGVTYAPAIPGTLNGSANQLYTLNAGEYFQTVITAATNVVQPDTSTVNYEIDKVIVDGTLVNGTPSGAGWNSGNSTLTLGALADGAAHVVVVTFKPVGEASVFATVEVVHRGGVGTVSPMGTVIGTVGAPMSITFTPGSGYAMDQIDLTTPSSPMADVTSSAVGNTYTTPALESGTTTVGIFFKSDAATYTVKMTIQYTATPTGGGTGIVPATAATVKFTNTASGDTIVYGPAQVGAYKLNAPTAYSAEYEFELAAGTWNVEVSKNGYLDYTIKDFVIGANGATAGTTGDMTTVVTGGIIYFGRKGAETESRPVYLTIGDATWDRGLIALNDIAQVANGMQAGANASQKKRADLDENGTVNVADMSYVTEAYGARSKNLTYDDFMS